LTERSLDVKQGRLVPPFIKAQSDASTLRTASTAWGAMRYRTMEAGMRSEQVYWVFTVTVDRMDKFKLLVPKLVAATAKEPGALQFECSVGDDQKTVDFFERYTDSKAALFHQTESFGPFSRSCSLWPSSLAG
jgi:quinol monooxygenase YgiN